MLPSKDILGEWPTIYQMIGFHKTWNVLLLNFGWPSFQNEKTFWFICALDDKSSKQPVLLYSESN